MKKIIKIEGMTCGHCSSRVEKALNSIEGVNATVNLKRKHAEVEVAESFDDNILKTAVEETGYTVTGIEVKKRTIFGR